MAWEGSKLILMNRGNFFQPGFWPSEIATKPGIKRIMLTAYDNFAVNYYHKKL